MRTNKKWGPYEVMILLQAPEEKTDFELSRELNRTVDAVRKKRNRLQPQRKKKTGRKPKKKEGEN